MKIVTMTSGGPRCLSENGDRIRALAVCQSLLIKMVNAERMLSHSTKVKVSVAGIGILHHSDLHVTHSSKGSFSWAFDSAIKYKVFVGKRWIMLEQCQDVSKSDELRTTII